MVTWFLAKSATVAVLKAVAVISVVAFGAMLVHDLQAAEGRRVKLHVLEQLRTIEEKAHAEELEQIKKEARLSAEQARRAARVPDSMQTLEGLEKCPANCLF